MKKLVIVLVSLIAIAIIVFALVLYVYVPRFFDKEGNVFVYEVLKDHIEADIVVEKAALSFWGQVQISIENINVSDPITKQIIFEVKNAHLNLPIMSLLKNEPQILFVASQPIFNLVADQNGNLNIQKIIKKQNAVGSSSDNVSMVALVGAGQASLSIKITDAQIAYSDLKSNSKMNFEHIDLFAENLRATGPHELTINSFGGSSRVSVLQDIINGSDKYSVNIESKNIDVNKALTSISLSHENYLQGELEMKMNFSGSGFDKESLKKNLIGSGNIEIKKGSWAVLRELQTLTDKIRQIPLAAGLIGNVSLNDKFKNLKANFTVKNQVVTIQEANIDMSADNVSAMAEGWVGFDERQHITGHFFLPAANPPASLKAQNGRLKIPFEIAGTVSKPLIKSERTIKALTEAYLGPGGEKKINESIKKLKRDVKDPQLKKLLEKVPDNVQDALKGLGF